MMMSKTIRKRRKDDKRAKWHEEKIAADVRFAVSFLDLQHMRLVPFPP